jgi:hypothetical protein
MGTRGFMSTDGRRLTQAAMVLLLLLSARDARAQPNDIVLSGGIKFNSGQNVQPIFEGWSRNADGSFQLHFGYMNRNYVEEIHVPIGPENMLEPAGPDRGQPTYFYTRFNRLAFSVTVPRDFGLKREVVWTLTVRGKTEKAVGWLQAEWEINPTPGGVAAGGAATPRGSGEGPKNTPPTLAVDTPGPATVSMPLTLSARVSDDGLPVPGKRRVGGNSENPPGFRFPGSTPTAPVNVPQVEPPPRPRITGLSVNWIVWRGPAGAVFEPAVAAPKDGQAVVTATFSKPGEYVLRARASDTSATTLQDVKITVRGSAPQ